MMLREMELVWLAKQRDPVWGGHLLRGEPPNPYLREALAMGLIEQVEKRGYIITAKGRATVAEHRCPTCGQRTP